MLELIGKRVETLSWVDRAAPLVERLLGVERGPTQLRLFKLVEVCLLGAGLRQFLGSASTHLPSSDIEVRVKSFALAYCWQVATD